MNKYLKTIGFSKLKKRSELRNILEDVIRHYDEKHIVEEHEDGVFAEFTKFYGNDCGITVCGQYEEENRFCMEYYFPFFRGTGVTTQEHVVMERHTDKESFAGACDDLRVGVTLIFYLQNPAQYMLEKTKGSIHPKGHPLTLSGLALEGRIILPVLKNNEEVRVEKETYRNRTNLIAAARNGDEDAMESLTMEDMDTYSMISQRIPHEDVLSIVDSTFMPYGIECDQYSVMGEILDHAVFRNSMTGDEMCQMTIDCNDIVFDICINKADLLGEPAIGRRFRGQIWLQGQLNF
ncbi:MAG: DUF3881 family protein [Blautia sp.]|nr:DUF3881 family protein [Blautia sp.]